MDTNKIEEEEDDIYSAVYEFRKRNGWYDHWTKKIRVRTTTAGGKRYILPTLIYFPHIKALGFAIWNREYQISWNKFN